MLFFYLLFGRKLSTYPAEYTLFSICQTTNVNRLIIWLRSSKPKKITACDHRARLLLRIGICMRECECENRFDIFYDVETRNGYGIWMLWQVFFSHCRGNQLGIKAASYQRICLIHSNSRKQQKAERLSCVPSVYCCCCWTVFNL